MSNVLNDKDTPNLSPSNDEQPNFTGNKLSINLVKANVVSAPTKVVNSIVEKADVFLNSPQSIVCAPGSADNMTYIVESNISSKPHFVFIAN